MDDTPLAEWLDFANRLTRRPREVGAIAPSGKQLCRLMVEASRARAGSRVLELGPGTGAITKALVAHGVAAADLTLIEFDAKFAAQVARRFAGAEVIVGDAFDPSVHGDLGPFDAIVSGIPLLNFPKDEAARMMMSLLSSSPAGAPFVQFSYGGGPPIPASADLHVAPGGFARRNLPPAKVWVYTLAR